MWNKSLLCSESKFTEERFSEKFFEELIAKVSPKAKYQITFRTLCMALELILKATSGDLGKIQVGKLMGNKITKRWFPSEWMLKNVSKEGNSIFKI